MSVPCSKTISKEFFVSQCLSTAQGIWVYLYGMGREVKEYISCFIGLTGLNARELGVLGAGFEGKGKCFRGFMVRLQITA